MENLKTVTYRLRCLLMWTPGFPQRISVCAYLNFYRLLFLQPLLMSWDNIYFSMKPGEFKLKTTKKTLLALSGCRRFGESRRQLFLFPDPSLGCTWSWQQPVRKQESRLSFCSFTGEKTEVWRVHATPWRTPPKGSVEMGPRPRTQVCTT